MKMKFLSQKVNLWYYRIVCMYVYIYGVEYADVLPELLLRLTMYYDYRYHGNQPDTNNS